MLPARLGDDPRVRLLAESLAEWQWPDGGWNCDKKRERLPLLVQRVAAADVGAARVLGRDRRDVGQGARQRTAELFLEHRLFRSLETGEPIHPGWLVAHYPPFWHYEVPQALLILSRMGWPTIRARPTGSRPGRGAGAATAAGAKGPSWWRKPGSTGSNVEVVDWGGRGRAR